MPLDPLLVRVGLFIPVLLALTVHEWAHAFVAFQLGDDTALRQGRLTLNPFPHLDPVGTILLPLAGVPFGWAKPVPVDPARFRPEITMEHGLLLTAAAGPVSNLILAMGCAALLRVSDLCAAGFHPALDSFLLRSTAINLALAMFNLLPIPPLDGSRIVDALIPFGWRGIWNRFAGAGALILLAMFLIPELCGVGVGRWLSGLSANLAGR
jgi:Zn-dependent protease